MTVVTKCYINTMTRIWHCRSYKHKYENWWVRITSVVFSKYDVKGWKTWTTAKTVISAITMSARGFRPLLSKLLVPQNNVSTYGHMSWNCQINSLNVHSLTDILRNNGKFNSSQYIDLVFQVTNNFQWMTHFRRFLTLMSRASAFGPLEVESSIGLREKRYNRYTLPIIHQHRTPQIR